MSKSHAFLAKNYINGSMHEKCDLEYAEKGLLQAPKSSHNSSSKQDAKTKDRCVVM